MTEENNNESPKVNGEKIDDNTLRVPLRKVIEAHGESLKEIVFREPTAADIEAAGNPVNLDMSPWARGEPAKVSFDEKKMTAMISRLATIPPSSVRAMDTRDWNNCAWALTGFFVPDLGTPMT